MNKDNLLLARQKRGQVEIGQLNAFSQLAEQDLIHLLYSIVPTERTIAATILGQRKAESAVGHLCKALSTEKALYAKLAICTALENGSNSSVGLLAGLLGTIGQNQETALPEKYFEKKSYPLARDIVARTLIRIGAPAIERVIQLWPAKTLHLLAQLIDTLGGLLHKTEDPRLWLTLKEILKQVQQNELLLWKTIRAFSAVPKEESVILVLPFLEHAAPAIRWESIRTLGLIATSASVEWTGTLEAFTTDKDNRIKQAALDAINRINVFRK